MTRNLPDQLSYTARTAAAMVRDPSWGVARVRGRIDGIRDKRAWDALGKPPEELYEATPDAHQRFHEAIGAPWPCPEYDAFEPRWERMVEDARQLPGPDATEDAEAFREHTAQLERDFDADPALACSAWCAMRHLRPERVVETGVARGVTSRFLLEGLEANGAGKLWSIDLPHPHTTRYEQLGSAVPEELRDRWTLLLGTSTRRLQPLLDELGEIDVFVHDSLHTTRNVRFELSAAWEALRDGGLILLDDVHTNLGFHAFVQRFRPKTWLVGGDVRRRGLWGMAVKS